jgi:outer membrane protein OmpA-like peptidoglycan-associated protein
MKHVYTILFIALLLPLVPRAQGTYKGEITFKHVQAKKTKDLVTIDFTINLGKLRMSPQLMITLTPVIRSNDNARTRVFDPVVIIGGQRDKALDRAIARGEYQFDVDPVTRVRRRGNRPGEIIVQLELPYAPWIRESRLVMHALVTGCGECEVDQRQLEVTGQTLPPLHVPDYRTSLVYPPVEPVKRRSDTRVARLDFTVGNADVLLEFKNNASTLEQVDEFFGEVISDPNLSIGTCSVTGYASPEGSYPANMLLSENRVYSFVNYLKKKYDIPDDRFKTRWVGEDWEGLLKLIEPLSFRDKEEVVRVIRSEPDVARREARLKALSGGATYRYLLENFYPALRRSEYTINYIARPFNITEAKELIHQKPCHLSLNEMYLVAHTREKGSDAFNEVFQVAVETFPDAPVARVNAAATAIARGQHDVAIGYLLFLDLPEAWNNLAIAYSNVKNYDLALEFFERAAKAGNEEATRNLVELKKFLDDYLY